ncbi:hypothetical protein AMAG_09077 [Allomyces macrogynus ATCC 38327]|uniref:G-protein coupled receptors family 3 profile domain-containing protein n=1 Tax=Allomyces macrogynus (strain ATCC 38327) TaxID=578462 RepID=A0A0L0SNR8_ALLM3|nr:hypothetical protein AMAG_09077 [Allomyces macrogynus ATCC 38327]|eukprot:KNE64019.1 hypothetical protein AMAG_09077 [Allomyces macrogynus ATCC 38327]
MAARRAPRPAAAGSPLRLVTVALVALWTLLAAIATLPYLAAADEIKLAGILPVSSPDDGPAASAAVAAIKASIDEVNQSVAGPAGHKVSFSLYDSQGSISKSVNLAFTAANDGAVGVIGELNSGPSKVMALTAQNLGMYTCSGSASAVELSDKTSYSQFFRTFPSDNMMGEALAQFVAAMKWRSVAVLASNTDYARSLSSAFSNTAEELLVDVATVQTIQFSSDPPTGTSVSLKAISEVGVRVVVFLGEAYEWVSIAPQIREAGLFGPEWVWVGGDATSSMLRVLNDKKAGQDVRELTQGFFYLFPNEIADSNDAKAFVAKNSAVKEHYAMLYRECLMAMARGFVQQLSSAKNKDDVLKRRNPVPVNKFLVPFDGLSGPVKFNDAGDRLADFTAFNIFDSKESPVFRIARDGWTVTRVNDPKFFDGSSKTPDDRPSSILGYLRYSSIGAWIVLGVTGLLALVIVVSMFILITVHKEEPVQELGLPTLAYVTIGLVAILGATATWIDVPTRISCEVNAFLLAVGFQLVFVPLLRKLYLFWTRFENNYLLRNHKRRTIVEELPWVLLAVVHPLLVLGWDMLSPLEPKLVATPSAISYQCVSPNGTVQALFRWISLGWCAVELASVLFLAMSVRRLQTASKIHRYTLHLVQNTIFSCIVLAPLTILSWPTFALGTYYIETAVMLYACGFAWGCLHLRIYNLTKRQHRARFGSNPPSPKMSSAVESQQLLQVTGKASSLVGEFPVKWVGRFASTWEKHRLVLALGEGYVGLIRSTDSSGQVTALKHIHASRSTKFPLCIELGMADKAVAAVQMKSEEQLEQVLNMLLSRHAPAPTGPNRVYIA